MTQAVAAPRRAPGEVGAWALIFTEMFIFGYLFIAFVVERSENREQFRAGQALLDADIGVVNTLLLLISSLFVVSATNAMRSGRPDRARPALWAALACGATFVGVKAYEYHDKTEVGLTPLTNTFSGYYYLLTALHLVHVAGGTILLACVLRLVRRQELGQGQVAFVEVSACFWHMVDLLWIVLFPLLYLLA